MLAHLTLDDAPHALRMDVRSLAPDCLIDVDPARYAAELAQKAEILAAHHAECVVALPDTEAMQWDALAVVLANMARHYPQWFALSIDGDRWRWTNTLIGEATAFTFADAASLPHAPLDWLARQVQEDLCLMDPAQPGVPLVAGSLVFTPGWSLGAKMGQPFVEIHDPVPEFAERIGRSGALLLARLKPDRPTARVNWGLDTSDRLHDPPHVRDRFPDEKEGITVANAGERLFLRSEWQTLARLPRTGGVLFTIRTRIAPLAVAVGDADDARRLAALVRTIPAAMQKYKGIERYGDALLAYLDARTAER